LDSLFEIGFILYKHRKKLDEKKMKQVIEILEKCKQNVNDLFKD